MASYYEGQTATNPKTGEKLIYKKGSWVAAPVGMIGDAGHRGRISLAFDSSVAAHNDIEKAETTAERAQSSGKSQFMGIPLPKALLTATPLQNDWGAVALDSLSANKKGMEGQPQGLLHGLAKGVGGDDYQAYNQAAKSFESSLLPVFSGSAVTPTEAQRFIQANMPEYSDSPATLRRKAMNRKRILNGAAAIVGKDPPYPEVDSWMGGADSSKTPGPASAPARPAPAASRPTAPQNNDPLGIR